MSAPAPSAAVARNASSAALRRRLRDLSCDRRPTVGVLPALFGNALLPAASLSAAEAPARAAADASADGRARRQPQRALAFLDLLTTTALMRHPSMQLPNLLPRRGAGINASAAAVDDRTPACIEALYKLALVKEQPVAAAQPAATA